MLLMGFGEQASKGIWFMFVGVVVVGSNVEGKVLEVFGSACDWLRLLVCGKLILLGMVMSSM